MNARYDYPGNPIDNGLVVIQADCLSRAYDEIDRLRAERDSLIARRDEITSARDDYQYGERGAQFYTMCDEIDALRADCNAALDESAALGRALEAKSTEVGRLRSFIADINAGRCSRLERDLINAAVQRRALEAGGYTMDGCLLSDATEQENATADRVIAALEELE